MSLVALPIPEKCTYTLACRAPITYQSFNTAAGTPCNPETRQTRANGPATPLVWKWLHCSASYTSHSFTCGIHTAEGGGLPLRFGTPQTREKARMTAEHWGRQMSGYQQVRTLIRTAAFRWRQPGDPPYQDPPPSLPRFRDMIRIVKRHEQEFGYDPNPEESGQNARIRTAATWRPTDQLAMRDQDDAKQPPHSAPARIDTLRALPVHSPPSSSLLSEGIVPISTPAPVNRSEPKDFMKVADADPMWQFKEREEKLKKEIVAFLDNQSWNPNGGSVPSERVQNCIKAKFPGLYRSVVGAYYSNQWHRFIQKHGGPEGFALFLVQDGKRSVWRIRLERHTGWEEADALERRQRDEKEQEQLKCLWEHLQQVGGVCKVDDFISEYELKWKPTGKHDLPKRGDFVRFGAPPPPLCWLSEQFMAPGASHSGQKGLPLTPLWTAGYLYR